MVMLIIYFIIILGGLIYLALIIAVFVRAYKEKKAGKTATDDKHATDIYLEILMRSWGELKHSDNRKSVIDLADAIQKLAKGQDVKDYELINILSQINGAEHVIDEIRQADNKPSC